MRVSTAFFYAVVFFAATFMLYFMLELTGISTSHGKASRGTSSVSPAEEEAVNVLERKLVELEATIQKNSQLIDQLSAVAQKRVKKTNKLPGKAEEGKKAPLPTGSDVIADKMPLSVTAHAKSQTQPLRPIDSMQQCPAAELLPAKTDIQISSVYDLLPFNNLDGGVWKQGFELTYEPTQWSMEKPLQVFVVPHSHNDPGWIRTFEEYFEEQTKHILNLMVKKLPTHAKRRFIWAEISYLSLWWSTASEESKTVFKKLVKDGQVEIVTGGWVMNDEANSHYSAMINQMIEGHEWIKNHIGTDAVPKHGWAIDPFGMSSTMAYILHLNQFDGMLIQRTHYSVKKHLGKVKALEFQWRQTWDGVGRTDMLCHMMPFYSYDIPHTCGPDPKVCCQFDFRRIPASSGKAISCPWGIPPRAITAANVKERAETLLDQYRKKAQLSQTNVVLAPLGDDFRYDSALEWDRQFLNYEKLIRYYSSRPDLNVQVQFGTLKDYFDAVKKDVANRALTIPSLSGDFFTYADRDDHYWSGYYTSRPFYKSLERRLEAHLRSAEIAYSMALARQQRNPTASTFLSIDLLFKLISSRRNLALFQHHDGVAGTAKTPVMADYAIKMISALTNCDTVLAASLTFLLSPDRASDVSLEADEIFPYHAKPSVKNRLQIPPGGRRVAVFNSLGQSREERVTLRLDSPRVFVLEEKTGAPVLSQVNPVWVGRTGEISTEEFELVFLAVVPPLAVKSYVIQLTSTDTARVNIPSLASLAAVHLFSDMVRPVGTVADVFPLTSGVHQEGDIVLESDALKLSFEGKTGYLKDFTQKSEKISMKIGMKFIQYGTVDKPDKSGAYLFLPDGDAKDVLTDGVLTENVQGVPVSSRPLIRVIRGSVVSELQMVTAQFIQTVRIVHTTGPEGQAPEVVNEVDITRTSNYELAIHLTTAINNDHFVTDLNGFQLIRRKTLAKLPLQANYYPMPAVAFVEDDNYRLTLLGQQPLGVASLQKGSLEVMQDRRLDQDDNRGLGQPVRDNVPLTKSVFRLLLETNRLSETVSLRKAQSHPVLSLLSHLSLQSLLNPYVVLSDSSAVDALSAAGKRDYPGLPADLPCDVYLLNLRTSVASESDDGLAVSPFPTAGKEAAAVPGSATALMLLHRVGVDCRRPLTGLKCQSLQGKLDLKATFQTVFSLPYVEEGSPSPLTGGKLLPVTDATVQLDPMHVHAFRFPLI